ncbi:UNVERIFIED_CONTAM: hypothetical protein FKN15_052020 [Acipenser sinensis]
MVKKVFCQSPMRRHQYLKSMEAKPRMPVFAVQTQWCSWVKAVAYLSEYLYVLTEFIQVTESNVEPFKKLSALLNNKPAELLAQATVVMEHSSELVKLIEELQATAVPQGHNLYQWVQTVQLFLDDCASAGAEDYRQKTVEKLAACSESERERCVQLFQHVMVASSEKLRVVLQRHPSIATYKAAHVFDPHQFPQMDRDKDFFFNLVVGN